MVRKNISIFRLYKHSLLQLVIAMCVPVLVGCIAFFVEYAKLKPIMILAFAAIPSVVNIYLIFYSSLYENRSKVTEILSINGIGVFIELPKKL